MAHLRARGLLGVLAGVALVLVGLELVYLVAGNAVIQSQLIRRAIASAEGFALDYGRAYTLWPGHVRVRDLWLRFEDYNVQFEVVLGEATLDIDLARLPFKKFRITSLRAEDVGFRMRHKIITVGDDAERIAAYPPIRGLADPPYYSGVRSPPIPDDQYDLWELQVENVSGRVRELWVMEYRLRGAGEVEGSFVVRPARWVQVRPAALEWKSGTLTLGEHRVASSVKGRITCDIPDMQVQKREGLQVLKDISAGVDLELGKGQLDFLSAYLARLGSARYGGSADWLLQLRLERGVIQPGTRVMVRAEPFELHHALGDLSGDLVLNLARDPKLAPDRLQLTFMAPQLRAQRKEVQARGPTLEGVTGSLALFATDLTNDVSIGPGQLAVRRVAAPDLGWFAPAGTTLGGSGAAELNLERRQDGELKGQAHLELDDASYEKAGLRARADVRSELVFAGRERQLTASRMELSLTQARLQSEGKQSDPFALRLDGAGLQVRARDRLEARGQLRLRLSSAEALLPLVVANPWRGLGSTALDLEQEAEARAQLQLRGPTLELSRIDASSGDLRLRGYLSKRAREPRGAFLLSSGLLNVGVTLAGGDTEVSPFVGDDWLSTQGASTPARAP